MPPQKISRVRTHFRTLKNDVLPRFQLLDITPGSSNQLEDYHSISEYKRKYDNIRDDINAFGVYKDDEFELIKHIVLDKKYRLAFILSSRAGELVIQCGLVKLGVPKPTVTKVVFTLDEFKAAINGFSEEVLSLNYNSQKKHTVKKLMELFSKYFQNGIYSEDERFSVEAAVPILRKRCSPEFTRYERKKTEAETARNESQKAFREIQAKISLYRKELEDEYGYIAKESKATKNESELLSLDYDLRKKIELEYKKDKRFIFGFSFSKLKEALNLKIQW